MSGNLWRNRRVTGRSEGAGDDDALWCSLRDGVPEAYRELERLVRATCSPVFRREGASRALVEALLQDVLVSVWTFSKGRAEAPANLGAFLYWRARGVWSRHFLAWRRSDPGPIEEVLVSRATGEPLDALALDELARALEECSRSLGEPYLEVWRARHDEGLDPGETASRLGLARSQVAVLLHRARKRIAACLERKGVLP